MPSFPIRALLLDVEGTTSSVSYVYDVLFPFAREHAADYIATHHQTPAAQKALDMLARDAGAESWADWTAGLTATAARQRALDEVARLMDGDIKATGLKELQGLIWKQGFESGQLRAHIYEDVPPALAAWQAAGLTTQIYSSGSIAAQKLFFGHTERGNLLPNLSGHYDTTTGPKREELSYQKIAEVIGLPTERILFLSDIVPELDAARTAGMQTALVVRPGNAPVDANQPHPVVRTFAEVRIGE